MYSTFFFFEPNVLQEHREHNTGRFIHVQIYMYSVLQGSDNNNNQEILP